ncbi:MAG: putative glycoside hydrolase, partial [bacterium]|nr:putative glycoside hydrolase [bacterium]
MIGKIFFAAAFGVTAGIALIVFIVLYGPGNEAPRAVERPVLEQTHFFVPQIVSPAQTPVEPERVEVEIHEWVSGAVPGEVRGIYLTRWSAGSAGKLAQVLELARQDIINAVVIDVKDFSGYLAYDTDVPLAKTIGAEQRNIPDPESYLASLHEAGLYTIARITVFQDPVLAEARPDLAIKFASSNDREIWRDHKGLPWVDPASKEVWEYNAALAKDAFTKGFDEVNFDYIRFPSDGD